MKKVLMVFASCVMVAVLVVCVGCDPSTPEYKKIMAKDETDGQFYYYYDKEYLKGYAIVGDMGENNPEIMYLPAYYKGKEVKQVFYTTLISSFGVGQKTFGPSFKNVKKLYVPFSPLKQGYDFNIAGGRPCVVGEIYYAGTTGSNDAYSLWLKLFEWNSLTKDQKFYFECDFQSCIASVLKKRYSDTDYYAWEERVDKTILVVRDKIRIDSDFVEANPVYITFFKSNTVFCFNYENSPNGGVFFVDNSDYGGVIKNTPYNPIRDGYEFTGWFKEAECVNKWKFDTDTLPTVDIDENGNVTEFIETKLYAGWRKI